MLEKQGSDKNHAGKQDFFERRRFFVMPAIAVSFVTMLFMLVMVVMVVVLAAAAFTVNVLSKMIFVFMFHKLLLFIKALGYVAPKLLSERCERRNERERRAKHPTA